MTGMTLLALLLVLLSAAIHTGWNLLLKQATDRLAFATGIVLASVVFGFPPALYYLIRDGLPPWPAWLCALGTSLLWLVYYEWLARSYDSGDLSVAYPVIRGISPVAAVGFGLAMGERPTVWGLVGVALIVFAVWWISLPPDGPRLPRNVGAAVLVGTVSAIYSAIDKFGVTLCSPLLYIWICLALAGVWLTIRTRQIRGPGALRAAWQAGRARVWWAGVGDHVSYWLILVALTQAHVMYVVPLRATAVLYSVLIGGLALGESAMHRRLLAGLVMIAGVALLAIKG